MERVCAWCGKELSPGKADDVSRTVTHGICSVCALEFTRGVPTTLKQMLDLIDRPVLVVDGTGVVRAANDSGLRLLGKQQEEIADRLGGEVFDCVYARLPGGCGQTKHCATCAVRNILMDTLAHDRSYRKVPAFQRIRTPEGERVRRFTISTEKAGDMILLRVDDSEDVAAG
ncbi:MAG: hypothetical protein Kow0089_11350 [Desulfobulbaceae bacterium]